MVIKDKRHCWTELLTSNSIIMAAVETMTVTSPPMGPVAGQDALQETPAQAPDAAPERVTFDPSKHLVYTPPQKVWTMKELGFDENRGISPVGVSEPFPLFSEEAVKQMREEVLSENVWKHYRYSSNLSPCQLRGYAAE